MSITMNLQIALNALRTLLFPLRANCMGCGAATGCREDWICPACRQALTEGWVGASPPPEGIDAAAFAYVYHGAAVGLVSRLKYGGVYRLAGFMGGDMARAYRFIEPTGADCVTCVPMHPKRGGATTTPHCWLGSWRRGSTCPSSSCWSACGTPRSRPSSRTTPAGRTCPARSGGWRPRGDAACCWWTTCAPPAAPPPLAPAPSAPPGPRRCIWCATQRREGRTEYNVGTRHGASADAPMGRPYEKRGVT